MKSKLLALVAATVLISGTALPALAAANSNEGQHKLTGNENALSHVKNEKARAAIRAAMERHKLKRHKHEREDEDQDQDQDQDQDEGKLSAEQRVAADKSALQIDFGGTDTLSSVTVPLDSLPYKGKYGSAITWVSSNPSILSNDGKTLNRPTTGDVNITMMATITYGNVNEARAFVLTVKQQLTDAQIVAADKAALAITYAQGDSAGSVTRTPTLPTKGANGSSITWISSASAVVSNDGKTVNRPAAGSSDVTVVLTAVLTKGGVNDIKPFTVVVKQQLTDAQKVAADTSALAITYSEGDSAGSVTKTLDLSLTGVNGSQVAWVSSNPSVLSSDGKTINRPAAGKGDVAVVLTAYLSYNGISGTKQFTVVVKQQLTDSQKVAADNAALAIDFSGSDTVSSVTGPLTLANVGKYGSDIVWISSNTSVISNTGKIVVRPVAGSADVTVVMTAIIMSNGVSDLKSFALTVKAW